MKRILIIFSVVLIFGLCSCTNQKKFTAPNYPVIESPDSVTRKTIDGYRKTNNKSEEEKTVSEIYYGNKKSKKFHYPDCTYAMKMSESSLVFEKERDAFINKGYAPCSKCNP